MSPAEARGLIVAEDEKERARRARPSIWRQMATAFVAWIENTPEPGHVTYPLRPEFPFYAGGALAIWAGLGPTAFTSPGLVGLLALFLELLEFFWWVFRGLFRHMRVRWVS